MIQLSVKTELKTWSWITKVWLLFYPVLMILRVISGLIFGPIFFWLMLLILVPLVIVPSTYWNLVGGGCSLRFHICPFVKGILAGMIFLLFSVTVDTFLNLLLTGNAIWSFLQVASPIPAPYHIWWLSGGLGGILARIMELRGATFAQNQDIVIVGHHG